MKTEIEARYLECDENTIIETLKKCNASFIGDWLQVRKCYDFNPVKENSWIRLRTNGKETTLTIKEIQDNSISGTKEMEIVVSDFDTTDEILNKLGYIARTTQENRRIRFLLDGVEIDIDSWPMIPTYIEFEGESEEAILGVCEKLGLDSQNLTTLDVDSIYKHYGINLKDFPHLTFSNDNKELE